MKNKNDELKRKIYEFYIKERNICCQQYEKAENPQLGEIYYSINDKNVIHKLFSKVSIVLLTANKYEKNILHSNWFERSEKNIVRIPITLFENNIVERNTYAYYFVWHGYHVLHIEAQVTGSYTLGGSADIVRYVLENPYLCPLMIISLGICFGVNENRKELGDTVISEKIYPYFIGSKYDEKGYFVKDDNMFRINDQICRRIKSELLDVNVYKNLKFKVDLGNYITGEAVISNRRIRDTFANITKQNIAVGEMEGYGLFKECRRKDYQVPCMIVKSICDWAVLKNISDVEVFQCICKEKNIEIDISEMNTIKDRLQAYASYNAFEVLDIMMEKHIFYDSVYACLVQKITSKKNEYVIYFSRVEETVNGILEERLHGGKMEKEIIHIFLKNMIEEHILEEVEDLEECDKGKVYSILNNK